MKATRVFRVLPDYGNGLGRGDVVPRIPIVFPRIAVKVFLNDLLPPRQSIAPAHSGIVSHAEP